MKCSSRTTWPHDCSIHTYVCIDHTTLARRRGRRWTGRRKQARRHSWRRCTLGSSEGALLCAAHLAEEEQTKQALLVHCTRSPHKQSQSCKRSNAKKHICCIVFHNRESKSRCLFCVWGLKDQLLLGKICDFVVPELRGKGCSFRFKPKCLSQNGYGENNTPTIVYEKTKNCKKLPFFEHQK